MKVSGSFYFRSWFKKSLMAIGTGFVAGIFFGGIIPISVPPINALLGSIIAFLIYQGVSFSRFWGKRRGEFEYEYRYDLIEKRVKHIVLKHLGLSAFIIFFQDQFNSISASQEDLCKKLIRNEAVNGNAGFLYAIHIKLANLALKEGNYKKEKGELISALELRPNDLLANYRLAVCCEMEGLVDDAVTHYRKAMKDEALLSEQLKSYILSQIERIRTKGPLNRPPAIGARYMTW